MSILEESLLNVLIVTWFHFRESAINPHISICKPPLEENMVCGPINFFKNVYIGAQVQQACGPCKKGLVCKQVGWVSLNTAFHNPPWCVKVATLAQDKTSVFSQLKRCSPHFVAKIWLRRILLCHAIIALGINVSFICSFFFRIFGVHEICVKEDDKK